MSAIKDETWLPIMVTCMTQIGDCQADLHDDKGLPIMPRAQYGKLHKTYNQYVKLFREQVSVHDSEELYAEKVLALEAAVNALKKALIVEGGINKQDEL